MQSTSPLNVGDNVNTNTKVGTSNSQYKFSTNQYLTAYATINKYNVTYDYKKAYSNKTASSSETYFSNLGYAGGVSKGSIIYTYDKIAEYTDVKRIPIKRNRKAYRYIRVWYSGHWYSRRYRIRLYNAIRGIFGLKPIK